MQLSTELFRALARFLSELPLLRDPAERERLVEIAFHQERDPYQALAPLERETQAQYATRLVRTLEGQRCGPMGQEWAFLVYLEVLHEELQGGDAASVLAGYLARLRTLEDARLLIQEAELDLSAATLEEIIAFYLDEMAYDFALTAQEYVDLSGEQTSLAAPVQAQRRGRGGSRVDMQAVLGIRLVPLDGEHCAHDDAARQSVQSVRQTLLTVERGVLLGAPGSGKSWTLRQLALDHAARWQAGLSALVPIFVELRNFGGMAGGARQDFADFLRAEARVLGPYLERLHGEGRLVLILDALNEMARHSPLTDDLVAQVRRYLADKPRFVLSGRVRDYQRDLEELRPLEQLYLRDLTPPQMRAVLHRRLGTETGEALWQAMEGSEALLGFWQKVVEQGEESRFWEAGYPWPWEMVRQNWEGHRAWQRIHRAGARLMPLCRNPFRMHLLCWMYLAGERRLPGSRAALLQAFIAKRLHREAWYAAQRGEGWPEQEAILEALVQVARVMQEAASSMIKAGHIRAGLDPTLIDAAIATNLLVAEGVNLRFSHQVVQEYFAARPLLAAMEGNVAAGLAPAAAARFFGAAWWDAGGWRETMVILGEFLGEGARGPNRVAQWLAPVSPEVAVQVILRHGEGLTVADVEPETRAALVASAQAKTHEPDPRGRAAAYRVLALLEADERPGVGVRADGVPDIEWVKIPGGRCQIGGDEGAEQSLPAQEVDIPTFWIATYPVTNWQWEAFVADGGYETEVWWEGLEKPEPAPPSWRYGNHPRETIDWYEANAFCRWLSARLGYEVRLPTEEEWEKATRGTAGRLYPWGNDYSSGYANIDETWSPQKVGPYYLQQTSAVGMYPQGATPKGVYDLSGNVWEWSLTGVSIVWGQARVLRGGSWADTHQDVRAAYHFRSLPGHRGDCWGFRVVRVAPPEAVKTINRKA